MHQAYDFALSFDNELVAEILDQFKVSKNCVVADPFCGTGTTLIECKRRGIRYIGIDANPACVFISKGKLDWNISSTIIDREVVHLKTLYNARVDFFIKTQRQKNQEGKKYSAINHHLFKKSSIGQYLVKSGMMKRGWIGSRPALKTLFVIDLIKKNVVDYRTRRFFLLSLLGLMVPDISNMRYGPEIYRAKRRHDVDVFGLFEERVKKNFSELNLLRSPGQLFNKQRKIKPQVYLGDSVNGALGSLRKNSIDYIISSPPYPCEHDYTRLTRLELVFGEHIASNNELRTIKKRLIRCCTRNIYHDDEQSKKINRFVSVRKLIDRIEKQAKKHDHGFARLYGKVVGEYFGGMHEHFKRVAHVLRPGGKCAYIVGDQASFFSIQIHTAELLSRIAQSKGCNLRTTGLTKLRSLRGTTGKRRHNHEWLLILEKKK